MGTAALRMLHPFPTVTLINIATYTYTMFPFYRKVESAIKQRLVKEGKVDSYLLMGIGNLLLLSTNRYFTAALGVGLAYVGDAIQAKATETAQKQLTNNLFDNLFDPNQKVWIVKEGIELESSLEQVQQGDILVVKAGETIPIDGEVVAGMASVDQHAFTGESYPVEKGVGESVFASTLMLTGRLQVQVEKSGHETTIGRIGEILNHSFQAKTERQLRGEQWAEAANLPFLGLAGFGLVAFGPVGAMVILSGNTVQAIRLLAPLATINYQAVASHQQILIKQGQRLEQISSIDTFLFDKTGTLTDGELNVTGLFCVHPNYQETDILFYAAVAEHQLTHPIAKAIMQHARQAGLNVENLDDIEYRLGYGIVVQFDNRTIHVGSARFMAAEGIHQPEAVTERQADIHAKGHSLVMIAINNEVAGLIELEATLRPEVSEVFKTLRQNGIKHIGIVSGDHTTPTQKLAEQLGADSFFAEVLPEDKAHVVGQIKAKGHTVCFVGDGVNDAIAMQQADLSISLRGATTLATDVADIILTDPNLTKLCELLELSRRLEVNLKRGLGICYLGMGTVLIGTFLAHIDILVAMGVHFVLGSTAIGNAMLPLLDTKKKLALPVRENSEPSNNLPPPNDEAALIETATHSIKPLPLASASKSATVPSQPLVIVGAGAAGMAGALTAAAQGTRVVLLEQSGQLGGTVTQTLIHTLGGLFDDQGDFLNLGLPVELTERLIQASPLTQKRRIGKTWTLSVDPEVYAEVVGDWINEYSNIEVRYHTTITNVLVKAGRIDQVTVTDDDKSDTLHPQALIDTTGHADIVRQIDVSKVTEGVALAGLIIQLRGVTPEAVKFPKGVALLQRIRKTANNQELPPECATLWLDSGVYPDEVYIKFNLISSDYDKARMVEVAEQLLTFLHAIPDFSQAFINARGQLGIRDGGCVQGDYTLTEADLKQGQRFPDAVCQAGWPIEHWHPQQGVTLDYFPPGHRYDIPLRSLKVSDLHNLFVAGKCFSAEPRAQASARVVGTGWAMGEGLVKALIQEDT
jgi:heavy metal translocating P-type ATPase